MASPHVNPSRLSGRIAWLPLAAALLLEPVIAGSNAATEAKSPPKASAAVKGDPAVGKVLFEQRCSICHGMNGGGGRGPNLRQAELWHASNPAGIAAVIKYGIPPDMPDGWYFSDVDLANLSVYVFSLGQIPQAPLTGDAARGQVVFEQSGCLGCHMLGGRGHGYGPDLTNIGATRGAESLRQTLIDPKSSLPPEFLLVEVVTAAGQTIQGIRRNEDTMTIQIQDPTGAHHSLVKSRLRSLKRLRGATPMPPFGEMLSKQQLDDLVTYLALQRRRR